MARAHSFVRLGSRHHGRRVVLGELCVGQSRHRLPWRCGATFGGAALLVARYRRAVLLGVARPHRAGHHWCAQRASSGGRDDGGADCVVAHRKHCAHVGASIVVILRPAHPRMGAWSRRTGSGRGAFVAQHQPTRALDHRLGWSRRRWSFGRHVRICCRLSRMGCVAAGSRNGLRAVCRRRCARWSNTRAERKAAAMGGSTFVFAVPVALASAHHRPGRCG